jgi:hypothetical protein
MTMPIPYGTSIYSDIYEIPYAYMQQHNLIELIQKNFTRCIQIKKPSIFQKRLIKTCKEETEQFMIGQNADVIFKFNRYLEFLKTQKELFDGDSDIYDFSFNRSTRGFQVEIKRPTQETTTRTDILGGCVQDLETSIVFYPIIHMTAENYKEVIEGLYKKRIIEDKEELIRRIETVDFETAKEQIKGAYMARINEFKVHLQVKPEYQFWVLDVLNKLIRTSNDFKNCIDAIKMHNFYDVVMSEDIRAPSIVIYLSGNNLVQTDEERSKCLSTVVEILWNTFEDYSKDVGLDMAPRYNHTCDQLIYWSNGPGDIKVKMIEDGLIDEFFDKDLEYSQLHPIKEHMVFKKLEV